MTNGHSKGARGELEVVRLLTSWWHQLEPEAVFKRTPMSGGWATPETRSDFKVAGDICTTAKLWPFTIEVKRREAWSFGGFTSGKMSPVWKWWRQCIEQAAEEDRIPILWARKNGHPWIVLAPERLLVPIVVARNIELDVTLTTLSPRVDDGDIRPACLLGTKFLQIPPTDWVTKRRGRRIPIALGNPTA